MQNGIYLFQIFNDRSNTIREKNSKPVITPSEIPDGEIGVAYNLKFEAESDTAVTWSLSGTLPKGLKFDKSSAVIFGIPIQNGTYKFKVNAKNKAGTTSASFAMTITGENPVKPKIITSKQRYEWKIFF